MKSPYAIQSPLSSLLVVTSLLFGFFFFTTPVNAGVCAYVTADTAVCIKNLGEGPQFSAAKGQECIDLCTQKGIDPRSCTWQNQYADCAAFELWCRSAPARNCPSVDELDINRARFTCAQSVMQSKPECSGPALLSNGACVAAVDACVRQPKPSSSAQTRKSDCDAIAARNAACEVIAVPADRADCQQQAESAFNTCIKSCVDCTGGDGAVLPQRGKPEGYTGPIPDCAFTYEGCRDVNNLLELLIKVGQAIFGIIGSIAFLMFIYGGFTIILAQGSAEKFKKGYGIVFAAVIGLLVSFAAYIIVDLVLEALNVSSTFRGIK